MIDMQTWFTPGKRMTVTVDITDTAKVEELMTTLNNPSAELVSQNGFTVNSFSFQDSNRLALDNAQITKVVLEKFIETGNYDLLVSLLGNINRSKLFFYPELKYTSVQDIRKMLYEHEGKVLTEDVIENAIKELRTDHE